MGRPAPTGRFTIQLVYLRLCELLQRGNKKILRAIRPRTRPKARR